MGVTGLHRSHLQAQKRITIQVLTAENTLYLRITYQIIESSVRSCNQKYFSVSLHRVIAR